jgi:hypothetical protein
MKLAILQGDLDVDAVASSRLSVMRWVVAWGGADGNWKTDREHTPHAGSRERGVSGVPVESVQGGRAVVSYGVRKRRSEVSG